MALNKEGLATFRIEQTNQITFAELVTLDAIKANQGVGTALIEALISRLRAELVTILRVTTTNDNLDALRFYQRRGFRIKEVRASIPLVASTVSRFVTKSSSIARSEDETNRPTTSAENHND